MPAITPIRPQRLFVPPDNHGICPQDHDSRSFRDSPQRFQPKSPPCSLAADLGRMSRRGAQGQEARIQKTSGMGTMWKPLIMPTTLPRSRGSRLASGSPVDCIVLSWARGFLGRLITAPSPVQLRPLPPPAACLAASDWLRGASKPQDIPLEIPRPRVLGPAPPRMHAALRNAGGIQISLRRK